MIKRIIQKNSQILYGNKYPKRGRIKTVAYSDDLAIGITNGNLKEENEDCVGFWTEGSHFKFAMADGHWGVGAAIESVDQFLLNKNTINEKSKALELLKKAEKKIYDQWGNPSMKPPNDLTPETSILCVEIINNDLYLASYGDCLAFLLSSGSQTKLLNQPQDTWLGAFSHLGLAHRDPIDRGLEYFSLELQRGDILILVTDGVTECKYEQLIIDEKRLALLINQNKKPEENVKKILEMVLKLGGEDNASCLIYKHPSGFSIQ